MPDLQVRATGPILVALDPGAPCEEAEALAATLARAYGGLLDAVSCPLMIVPRAAQALPGPAQARERQSRSLSA